MVLGMHLKGKGVFKMIWVSHIAVGTAFAKVFGLNYLLTIVGSILPDFIEFFSKRLKHRGVSHSLIISFLMLIAFWITPIRDVWIGVILGHLLMDSLTITGVPLWDERGMRVTLFGGRLRTGSMNEFMVSGIIVLVSFILIGSFNIGFEKRDWKQLYDLKLIDKKEYYEHRFKLF